MKSSSRLLYIFSESNWLSASFCYCFFADTIPVGHNDLDHLSTNNSENMQPVGAMYRTACMHSMCANVDRSWFIKMHEPSGAMQTHLTSIATYVRTLRVRHSMLDVATNAKPANPQRRAACSNHPIIFVKKQQQRAKATKHRRQGDSHANA